jgi:23S rRNA pseudouridine2605 synthase
MAAAGVASRRQCEIYIAEGRVRVDGEIAELGRRVDPGRARIELDGAPVSVAPGLVHYLLNKPVGVVSTAADPRGRPTVVSLVPAAPRVYPVGRLDMDSEGLLLLTNNGELTHRLTHPSYEVPTEYLAEVSGRITPQALRRLRTGVELDDGVTAPATVSNPAPGLLRIVIHEGRNRQVRRMVAAVGGEVTRLVRTRIGPVTDPRLQPGEWRLLEAEELRALERLVRSPDH